MLAVAPKRLELQLDCEYTVSGEVSLSPVLLVYLQRM
jgi:hypothetical protein